MLVYNSENYNNLMSKNRGLAKYVMIHLSINTRSPLSSGIRCDMKRDFKAIVSISEAHSKAGHMV